MLLLNPSKAGHFQGSFFWGKVNLMPVKAYYFNIIFRLKLYFLQYNIQYVYFHIKAQLCKSFYGTFLYVSDIKDSATVS